MRQYLNIIIQCVAVCLLIALVSTTWAQDSRTEFQETKKDFLKALSPKPVSSFRTKGIHTKGPAEIVPDEYDKLVQNPTARSLILFDFDSAVVKKESYSILRNLAEVLKNDLPEMKLVVAGHTDSVGSEEYNLGLSNRRAQAVKNMLVSVFRIDGDRLFIRWFGESRPLISNATREGRAKNRRVEFIRIQ